CTRLVLYQVFAAVLLIFFFQAEDGIRDATVTGVQTCALPISVQPLAETRPLPVEQRVHDPERAEDARRQIEERDAAADGRAVGRSEERRVGKECRCRW